MLDGFILRPLTRRQISQAYALVHHVLPDATLARWDSFARGWIGAGLPHRDQGIITLQSQTGYILGLFVYELRDDLQDGRTLAVSYPAVAELVGQATLARHLAEGMVTVARLHDCKMIDVRLPHGALGENLGRLFRHAGFELDGPFARHRLASQAPLAACASAS